MIELKNVSRSFQSFKAVDDVSFSIQTGEIVGFLGPNGAGKTTTMRMITSYLSSDEGTILIDGENICLDEKKAKKKIGYMSESAPLYGDMIVHDYLVYIANMHGENPNEKLPQLCDACGLKDVMHKNISDLSRGYKQRVGLAHALMSDPEILILDEPTAGLDPKGRNELFAQLQKMHKELGLTIILISHSMEDVARNVERLYVLYEGKIKYEGTPREVFANDKSLEEIGLGVPQIKLIMNELNNKGFGANSDVLTVEEAADNIMNYLISNKEKVND